MDADKFKNDLMIGEMSKWGKLALPAVPMGLEISTRKVI